MTEDEARAWVAAQPSVSRETLEALGQLIALITEENARQNVVAPLSLSEAWARHIADSAQLLQWGSSDGLWIDVGSGAGLPGLVIALLRKAPMLLVEPRRKRADFLLRAVEALDLEHVEVVQRDIRKVDAVAAVVSARAVAALNDLFDMTVHLARHDTVYVLPKGRTAVEELESVRDTWHGAFHVKQSVTSSDSRIVVATQIARKSR